MTQSTLPINPLDGVDISQVLTGEAVAVNRPLYLYFTSWELQCARRGRWKLHVSRGNAAAYSAEPTAGYQNLRLLNPELYDRETDPEEAVDTSVANPEIVASIQREVLELLPRFPVEVINAWRTTQALPVGANEPGAWPTALL